MIKIVSKAKIKSRHAACDKANNLVVACTALLVANYNLADAGGIIQSRFLPASIRR